MERKGDGSLYFMDRIWVPLVGDVRMVILNKAHKSKYSVHPGADKMYHDLHDMYWWPGMKRDIAIYIKWMWDKITMDLITNLPRSRSGHDAIWVIVDRLPKSAYFLAIREDFSMEKLAILYIDVIVVRHGVPVSIISDRDGRFTSHFWETDALRSLKRISLVAYRLRLPKELNSVHDTFHMSNLKKCLANANLHVPLDKIKVKKTLRFVEEPVEIMDQEIKKLKRRKIAHVKVRWNSKRGPEFPQGGITVDIRIKSGGLLAGIHGLFSGRNCCLVRRITCGYPWPELEGKRFDCKTSHSVDSKNKKFEWGDEQENAFQTLKDMLCDAPIQALPKGIDDFVVYYDASNQGFGCVLMQRNKARILEAQTEASKGVNTLGEMLKGLDKQFERKEDGGLYLAERIWVPVYGNLRILIMSEAHAISYFPFKILGQFTAESTGNEMDLSYHSSVKCALFEALYGRKCRTPIAWAEVGESKLFGLKIVRETTDKIVQIKDDFKSARVRQRELCRQSSKAVRI
ncbi:putative reverse transcriptase domain-containing protein [Tanacetum coccineum]